jgi:hypothetical protein
MTAIELEIPMAIDKALREKARCLNVSIDEYIIELISDSLMLDDVVISRCEVAQRVKDAENSKEYTPEEYLEHLDEVIGSKRSV